MQANLCFLNDNGMPEWSFEVFIFWYYDDIIGKLQNPIKYSRIINEIQSQFIPDMTAPIQAGKTSLFHQYEGQGFYLAQFKTPELAIFSYYLESKGQAILIDPTFDVYEYQNLASKRGGKLISILLTHYHADYLAGHSEFHLPIIMGPNARSPGSKQKIYEMKEHYTFNLGSVWLKILHTPGHTPQSTSFRLFDANKKQTILFTGDAIFLGEVGRPDLAVSSNLTKEDLARMLFNSLNKIRDTVNHEVRIYPAHGAGSSCGKAISDGNWCTLERQLKNNYALQIHDQKEFIQTIIAGMPKPPKYFFYDATLNKNGHDKKFDKAMENGSRPLSVEDFKKQVDKGAAIVDTRHDFGRLSIKNSYMITEKGPVANWVGMMVPHDQKIVLMCTPGTEKKIVERILRIGFDGIVGFANFTMQEWIDKGYEVTEYKIVDGAGLAADQNKQVLDVRNPGEWAAGHIEGAIKISMPEIKQRADELKDTTNLYVHCKSGWRARLSTSVLAQHGIKATFVVDEVEKLEQKGNKMIIP